MASQEVRDELHRLAAALQHAADNPAPTPLPAKWVEGFTDGVRFSAAALTLVADGATSPDAIAAAMQAIA